MTTLNAPTEQRWRIRSAIIATAVVGVLGLPAALLVGEPYPWIVMPGFSGAGGVNEQQVERTTAVFAFSFADDSVTMVHPPSLFADVPSSHYATLAARFAPDQAAAAHFEDVVAAVFPNVHAAARSGVPDANDPQVRAWLRRQAQRLFPERQAVAVDVYWQRISIAATGTRRVINSMPSVRFEL